MAKNIARVRSMVAEGQTLVDVLCSHSAGRTFDGLDSRPAVSVLDAGGAEVALRERGLAPISIRPEHRPTPGSNAVVFWSSPPGSRTPFPRRTSLEKELVYFAPTGSTVRSEHLADARRGNSDDLVRFNLQRSWLVPKLGRDVTQAATPQEPQVDTGPDGTDDVIEILASHCMGRIFNAPDRSSTVVATRVSGEAGGEEPAVVWSHRADKSEDQVYFVPHGSTPSTTKMAYLNSRPGSDQDLQAFATSVLPWLEPDLERMAGEYLDGLPGQALAV